MKRFRYLSIMRSCLLYLCPLLLISWCASEIKMAFRGRVPESGSGNYEFVQSQKNKRHISSESNLPAFVSFHSTEPNNGAISEIKNLT